MKGNARNVIFYVDEKKFEKKNVKDPVDRIKSANTAKAACRFKNYWHSNHYQL